jgi:hypothetical protein
MPGHWFPMLAKNQLVQIIRGNKNRRTSIRQTKLTQKITSIVQLQQSHIHYMSVIAYLLWVDGSNNIQTQQKSYKLQTTVYIIYNQTSWQW